MNRERLVRFLEFLIVGIVMGVVEDLIAIRATTGESLTAEMLLTVVLVAIPFAAFAELVIDREEIQPFERVLDWLQQSERGLFDPPTDEDPSQPVDPEER